MEPLHLTLLVLAAAGIAAVVVGVRQQRTASDRTDATGYLRSLDDRTEDPDEFTQLLEEPFLRRVLSPLGDRAIGAVGRLLPRNYRIDVHQKLVRGGMGGRVRAEEVITAQVLLGSLGLLVASAWWAFGEPGTATGLGALLLGPAVGVGLPVAWVDRKVEERQSSIRSDLPDTLDLMAISVEAGVGFEGALAVVVDRFDSPLARELGRTLQEMELGLSRREALLNLKQRVEVPELSAFIATLTQADALGMPIGRVLKSQAGELRTKRRQWAREKAGKLPIKILFPLMAFIFPPLFVILLGPAMSEIAAKL